MLLAVSLLFGLLVVWLVVTAFCIVLAIYRAVIGLREKEQLFIELGEERLQREQKEIAARIEGLNPYILGSMILSAVLGVATFAYWVYLQLH